MNKAITTNQNPEILTTKQAADYLCLTEATLTTWRCTKAVRVPFIKLGRSVRYRKVDLDAFIKSNVVGG